MCGALQSLGLDRRITEPAAKAIRYGSALNSAFGQLTKGDYLGAVTGLIGGLFGGGPSAEERIMEQLDEIKGLQIQTLKLREETLKQVVQIQKSLVLISQQIQQNHEEVLGRLGVMDRKLNTIMDVTLRTRLMPYQGFRVELLEGRELLSPPDLLTKIRTHDQLAELWKGGYQSLLDMVSLPDREPDVALKLRTFVRSTAVDDFLARDWASLYQLLVKANANEVTLDQAIQRLVAGTTTVDQLDKKLRYESLKEPLCRSFEDLLHVEMVIEYARVCQLVASVNCVLTISRDGARRPMSYEDIKRQCANGSGRFAARVQDARQLLCRAQVGYKHSDRAGNHFFKGMYFCRIWRAMLRKSQFK